MIKYFCLFLFIGAQSFASTDLGQELQLKKTAEGNFQFGVTFSYEKETPSTAVVPRWNVIFGLDMLTAPQQLKWNAYSTQTKTYLTDWALQPVQNGRDLLILGNIQVRGEMAKSIIRHQSSVVLVFGDPSGKALYHIDLGKMCRKFPTYFMNLTETSVRCDQVELP